ncbi:MAG TPA: pirin family protein [Marmoricola sp.]|nr:pirin family protein [Marmoricola sp.]
MTGGGVPGVEVRRGADRFATVAEGRTTRHSFSFDRHYDPSNVSMGFLLACNDDLLAPGAGYPLHPHRDLEIVTWVLSGALRHEDSTGRGGVVVPGRVQRLSAGSGVVHSEVNDDPTPLRFVQMWVQPASPGGPPSYDQASVSLGSSWVPLATGHGEGAVHLGNPGAALSGARLGAGDVVLLPEGPLLHLFVAGGSVEVEGVGALADGDALRVHAGGGRRVTGVSGAPELLLWHLHR